MRNLKKVNFLITKEKRNKLFIIIILLFFGMILEIFGLGILIPAISLIVDPNSMKDNLLLVRVLDFLDIDFSNEFIFQLLIFIFFLYFFKTIFLVFINYQQNKFTSNLIASISSKLFKKYLNLPYNFHLKRNSSDLIKNIQIEIGQLSSYLQSLMSVFIEGFLFLSVITTLIIIEPIGAISIGFYFIIASFIFYRFFKKYIKSWGEKREGLDSDISRLALEGIRGIKEIKILNKTNFFIKKFENKSYLRSYYIYNFDTISQLPRFYLELLSVTGLLGFISVLLLNGTNPTKIMTVLGVFVTGIFRLIPSLNKLISGFQNMKFYNSSISIIFNEISLKDEYFDSQLSSDRMVFAESIEIKNLNFKYSEELGYSLKQINLKIEKGQTIGFVGPSGSGKSTLVDIIIGLHKPFSGGVFVDGKSINENYRGWSQNIGYVPQNIFLTDNSIIENVALGTSIDKIKKQAAIKALKSAQLLNFVKSTKDGIYSRVGEHGVKLSGGQRQRLGIARALYHNPDVLILDEATASLDSDTEKEVMNSIRLLKRDKTILIIAHRLSTLQDCDYLFKIDNGYLNKINNQ